MSNSRYINLLKEYINVHKEAMREMAESERKAAKSSDKAMELTNKQHGILKILAGIVRGRRNSSEVDALLSTIEYSLKENLDYIYDGNKARIDHYVELVKTREKELKLLEMQMADALEAKKAAENSNGVLKMKASEVLSELKLMMDLAPLSTTKCEIQERIDKVIRDNLEWIKTLTKESTGN